MGWLRLVGSLKLYVSFAKEPYKRDDILKNRPTILRSLLLAATPYLHQSRSRSLSHPHTHSLSRTHTHTHSLSLSFALSLSLFLTWSGGRKTLPLHDSYPAAGVGRYTFSKVSLLLNLPYETHIHPTFENFHLHPPCFLIRIFNVFF